MSQVRRPLEEGELVLQFIRVRQAWYTQADIIGQEARDRLHGKEEFGFYAKRVVNGELSHVNGEFYVRWHHIEQGKKPVPRLEAFDDAWELLPYFSHLFAALHDQNLSGDEFQAKLLEAGLYDVTERTPLTTREQVLVQSASRQLSAKRKAKP